MTLSFASTRALPSRLFATLSQKLPSSRIRQSALLGVLAVCTLSVADARSLHHFVGHRRFVHRAVTRQAAAALSAGTVSSQVIPPAANLEAVLNPTTSLATVAAATGQPENAPHYELRLHHLHTGEDIDIVYRVGNVYIPSAIARLNYFLRDHRTQDVSHYDPREFDLLHSLTASLGRPNSVIDIVCGYRTPWSNNFLRTRSASTGVAKNSQHMQAKAIDIRIPGVTTSHLRDIALSLRDGGVGYYPVSQFVHVDVGPVRQWSFGGRGE